MKENSQANMIGVLPSQGADPIPVGKIPDLGTQIVKSGYAVNATVVIHTVTADKTLYLVSAWIEGYNGSDGTIAGQLSVRDTEDAHKYYLGYLYLPTLTHNTLSVAFPTPLEIPAGYDIYVGSGAAAVEIMGFIFGYEM